MRVSARAAQHVDSAGVNRPAGLAVDLGPPLGLFFFSAFFRKMSVISRRRRRRRHAVIHIFAEVGPCLQSIKCVIYASFVRYQADCRCYLCIWRVFD